MTKGATAAKAIKVAVGIPIITQKKTRALAPYVL